MNLKRMAAAVALAAGLLAGSASAAQADTNATFPAPGPGGCGQLLYVVISSSGDANFMHRDCDREAFSTASNLFSGDYKKYQSPTAAQREACGGVLRSVRYRASDGKALFDYDTCYYARLPVLQHP